jgi:hypothetical protein
MAEEKDIALLADNDIVVEIEVQEAPPVIIEGGDGPIVEITGNAALGMIVEALGSVAKEATLIAKVAELKDALNTIDFTAIEQAIQDVEDVTAREATLIQGVEDIIKAVENIDFTDLENSIAEVKNAVANIDFSALAKEDTLTQVASKVEEESEAIKSKIDAIPATDLTAVAKEETLNTLANKIDNIKLPEIDTTELASKDLERFFGLPAALPEGYEFMTAEEVCSTLEEIMTTMDINLTPEQAKEITNNTLNKG